MLIEQFLNESSVNALDNIPVLDESWITGENENELYTIANEAAESSNQLYENMIFAEAVANNARLNGNIQKSDMLLEKSVSDYWQKLKKTIVEWAGKVKAWFQKLWASIRVKVKASAAALDKAANLLNKDSYTIEIHNWKNTEIATTISNNAKSFIHVVVDADDIPDSLTNKGTNGIEVLTNSFLITGKLDNKYSHEMAIDYIKGEYGCKEATKETKTVSKSEITNMISFLKAFNNNKTIKESEKGLKELFNNAIKSVNDKEKKSQDKDKSQILNTQVNLLKAALKTSNSLLSTCITLEKNKYSEYKSAVLSAINAKADKTDK